MLNEKDLVTKYRETIYQETGTWIMPSVEINENPSDRAMQLVLSTNRQSKAEIRTVLPELPSETIRHLQKHPLPRSCYPL